MTIDRLIDKSASPVDVVIVEFENGTNEEFDMWNVNEYYKLEEHRYKEVDSFDMYDRGMGKVLQVWL